MKLGIVAGEASGNLLGAGLLSALGSRVTGLQASGIGGNEMIAAGCRSLFPLDRLSVMGLIEPLGRLPELFRIRRRLYEHYEMLRPDVFMGIDAPDFNLGLELKLKRLGIPVVHYVSPSVWAWRQQRIKKIAAATDLVLTLFPFEADFYHQHNVPATFVGHPLADMIPEHADRAAARARLGLDNTALYIALLAGSRRNELYYLMDDFIKTAALAYREHSNLRFITSAANPERAAEFEQRCRELAPQLPIHFFQNRSHDVLAAANAVLVTSGTATLETMLFKRPMVVAYRMAGLTFQLAKRLVSIKHIALPNLLTAEQLVPEFIQSAVQPEAMAKTLLNLLEDSQLQHKIEHTFSVVHQKLKQDANVKAADAVLGLLK